MNDSVPPQSSRSVNQAHQNGRTSAWEAAPLMPTLAGSDVHVWRTMLDAAPDFRSLLSPDEAERAGRFHFDKDRLHFVAARGWLRTLLGRYLDAAPRSLVFDYGERGKPALAPAFGGDIRFNLSHSAGLALLAIACGRELGVDVECATASNAGPEIAERFFSAAEIAALRGVPQAGQRAAFFAGWVRKEAYIKAIGAGLFAALDRFTVSLVPGAPAALLEVHGDPREADRWALRELHPGEGYAGAIAVEGHDWQLHTFEWATRPNA